MRVVLGYVEDWEQPRKIYSIIYFKMREKYKLLVLFDDDFEDGTRNNAEAGDTTTIERRVHVLPRTGGQLMNISTVC